MITIETITARISELSGKELATVVAAALARMGEEGRDGADALIARLNEMDEGTDAEQDDRGNVKEAVSWLAEEVSDEVFS